MTNSLNFTDEQKLYYTLRTAAAMCFIGHGAFGIITKPIWCNYFAVFGIGRELAFQLMPVVGSADILLGILMLFYPMRFIPAWLVVWGMLTALLRPLSGEPFAEFIERAGNYGAPLAFLLLCGGIKKPANLFSPAWPHLGQDVKIRSRVIACLKIVVFLLLAGHGWLNIIEKKSLIAQYSALGFPNPANAALAVGVFEIIVAFTVLVRPLRPVLLILFIWKMFSEFFYPHYELFEWIERGGSYGAILALFFAMRQGSPAGLKNETRKKGMKLYAYE